MIQNIEALHFRCLRYIAQPLAPFHILVGPNASGKTTFLDTIAFLGDLISGGLESAIEGRTNDLRDLVWQRKTDRFELAVDLRVPEEKNDLFPDREYSRCRYEIAIGPAPETGETVILFERVLLLSNGHRGERERAVVQESLFPVDRPAPETLAIPRIRGAKTVVHKVRDGNDKFYDENGTGWDHSFKLGPGKSALANLPEDETRFPITTWLKSVLIEGVQRLVLNSARMRRPSPPGQPHRFRPDGSNLPWVVSALEEKTPLRLSEWVAHLQTVLPDLEAIRTVERPEDRHRYLVVEYKNGLEIPSWTISDGTLRMLALTLPAYLPDFEGIYLIEEPENGIHPRAVETAFRSLSSVQDAQILLTTHSPVIISIAEASRILCFSKTEAGATDIVLSTENPALRDWRGETDLGVLFAEGVFG